jgi:hypothetical protein
VVKSLKLIASVWKNELRMPIGEKNIIQSAHDLVAVMDSKIDPKRTPVIS